MDRQFSARVEFEDGWYWAEVVGLPGGCVASGRDLAELVEALEESVGMCLSDDDEPLPVVRVSPEAGWRISVGPAGPRVGVSRSSDGLSAAGVASQPVARAPR